MKKQFWVSLLTIFLLTFISVAYASFSSVLTITGEATVVKDTTAPTCGSWYLRDSSLTTQEAYDQNKFINAGTNTTWSNTNKTLFIECTDNMDDEYGCVNVDTVTTSGSGKRYFKDVKEYTTSIKSDSNTVTVTLKDAYMNERTCTLPVGGSNPYIDKEEPTITITRSAANKFTYSATDNMSSSVTPRFMVTTSSTKPALDDANWSSSASEVTIDNSASKTYYVWAKDGVNITNSTISTYLLTKTQGTGTTLTLKYQNNSGATLSTGYVLNGTQVYATATPSTGYNTALIKKDSTTAATGTGTNSVNTTITVNAATTISSSATANTYSIGYTMNGGPNPSTKPTSGTYNANVNISNPGSKSVTITPNANSSGATVGSAVVATQTFAGWTSTTMQGNAQSGSTTSNYAAWTGTSTKNTYFKNLRNDTGTVTMVANWNTSASTLPTLTAPSGYTCKWYDTQGTSGGTELGGSGDPYTPSATSGSTVNVYARCTANTYYVYYNQGLATGGWNATTYATQSRTYPNSVTLRTNSMTKSNTTANSYTVTYNQGTATGGWDATTYGTQTSTNTTTYTANGWTTGSTNTNDRDYANGATYGANSTSNLTLYPNFTTSTTNGGVTTKTNSMTKSNSADSNSYTLTFKQGTATSAAPSAITNKKYTSYTANGWTTTSGSTSRTYANNTATGALSSNITLYPCFSQTVNQKSITLPSAATKSNTNLGTVTFNYNGSGAAATTSTAYTTYAFSGWYTASSGGTKLGNAGASYTPSASIDVYPQFTGTAHSATFPSPSRTGYTFAGWWTAASGGTQVTSYTGSSNVEYFAHWTENTYSLTFDGVYNTFQAKVLSPTGTVKQTVDITSSSRTISNISYTDIITTTTVGVSKAIDGTTFTKVAASNNPTRTGYSLGNYTMGAENTNAYRYDGSTWYTDYNGSSGCKTFSRMASTQGYNATLTLTWTANVYTITLDQQSGSGGTATIYEKYSTGYYTDSAATTQMTTSANPITAPSRSGYTFGGYYTGTNGSGTQYIDANGKLTSSASTTNFSSNGSLYAKWTPNTYYVYYNQGLATGGWSTSTYATQSRTYPNSTTLRTNSMTKSNTTANSYTVTYNQGTATDGWSASTYGTQTSINTTTYTANGWTTGATNLNDPDYANGASFGSNNTTNLTLYPNFTSSTTNGGVTTRTNSMTKSNSADSDSYTLTFKQGTATSAAPSAITNKKYTSYTANGWTTTSGSTSRTYANNTATGALSANVNLYPCFSQTVNQKSITLPSAATKSNTNLGTVTFNYNGSGAASTTSTGYTTYAFSGWYTASSGGTKLGNAGASYTPSASIDVYPQFTGTAHSATFPSNPTRTGYTFAGWWTAASGGTQVTSYTGSSAVEYFAHWTPNTYYVYYNQGLATGGWSTSTYATQSRTYPNSTTLRTNSMTKDNTTANSYTVTYEQGSATGGWNASTYSAQTSINTTTYTANGWTTGSTNLNDPDYANGATFGASNTTNLTLYPNFTTSTTNGGVITRTNNMTISDSDPIPGPYVIFITESDEFSIQATKYSTYTAAGWSVKGSGNVHYDNNVSTGALTSNITLVPAFFGGTIVNPITLPSAATKSNTNLGTVTFNYNGSGAAATTSTAYTTYAFKGWYTAASGGTKLGNAGDSYTPRTPNNEYAYPQFTGTAHSATFPSNPTRTGYTFAGWWTAASGGTQVTSYTGSSNVEYYAHWTPITYTIVYNKSNTNETGTLPSNQSATYDVGITLGTNSMSRPNSSDTDSYTLTFKQGTATSAAPSAITNKKYTSYTANGWATSANAGRSYTSGQTNVKNLTSTNNGTYNLYTSWSSTVNQKSITLPAAATKSNTNLGTVTFNYNGSGATSTTSTAYTTYAFSGWYTASSGGTKLGNASASYTPSASIDVYPQFTGTAHSATFPSSPTRTGYTFAGWYTASSGGTQVTSYTGSSNVEYYAHWTPNTYTIAYTMNNGTDPNPKPTSGTYDSNVSIGTTSIPTKTVTITGNANGTGASVGAATVNSLTFNGWSTSSGAGLQGNAQSGSTTSNLASWSGGATTNKYFKNLRNGSGTVTLTANWSTTVTLPTLSKTGHTCNWYDTSGTSGGSAFTTTISQNAATSITIYARCTANTYNITLNQQSGSGGTATIYEKYGDGYYLTNNSGTLSNKMSTTANGVTIPTRSGYTFGGYYTSTNGGGTQYIDASGKLTSSASATQFSSAGNLYAKWTLNTPATPTISGGATKVYGSSSTTLTCSNSTTYPSGITKKYQFGYASSDGGSPGNWTTESDSNTLTIAANAYVEQRWYSCRVRVYDGSAYSGYATSSTSADTEMTINNATLTFDANNGTGGGTVYTKTGQNVVYDGIRSTSTTSIPTASRTGYTFLGWYDAPSGGNKVLNADGSFTGTAVSGYTTTNAWATTTNRNLYAYWNGITYTITFHYGNSQRYDIPYTSNTYQTVTIPTTGKYRLEAWGAQGGDSVNNGGESHSAGAKGAYTSGVAPFNVDDTLYVYVGQKPGYVSSGKADNPGGWNGGGTGRWDHGDNDSSGGGGGATDFRYFGSDTPNLTVNNAVSLRYRIMVAGGGSGNAWSGNPGHAGALESVPRGRATAAVNQITGNSFGVGGTSSVTGKTKVGNSGGGGGYWGGRPGGARSGNTDDSGQGTGGSSYVSGYTGAVAVRDNSVNTPRYASDGTTLCTNGTTDNTCSIHFTGKVFEDPVMISGESAPAEVVGTDEELEYIMEEPDGIEVYGHTGHGHARVSLDSVQKQVTSGQVIGSAPLPYGNTYWGIEEEEGEDEEGVPFYYSYDVEYDIHWMDEEGNEVDLSEPYNAENGTDLYELGVPHEYSITYVGVEPEQFEVGGTYPEQYNALEEYEIDNPRNGILNGTYYKFFGWTSEDILWPTKTLEISKGDSGNKTFTANWETKSVFKVEYDANGGITTCPTQTGSYGEHWLLCDQGATYGNVEFLGWYTKPSGGKYIGTTVSPYFYAFGDGEYEGDYILYAHWDIDAIEYDYNITQSFAANRMINTYYAPDWTKTFEVEIKFSIATASKRYFLFGNYDNSASNALNLEVAQNNTIRVYVGKGSTNATFGSVSTNQESTVKALWNGTTQKLTVDVTGGGTGHYEGTLTALANISGKTNRHFRFGASDYRASSTPFNTINVKNFVIREFYGPPLQDSITVPDPAGHYYLFEGWTGPNGDTPQYNLTVPTNSEGLISYTANWSTGVSFKGYSKTFSTSNQYIKFKNEVTVVYIDQARRVAYTRERVNFYRTNDASPNGTYGQGSMTVRYNWSASYIDRTVDLAEKHIKQSGINLWSENWNAYSISYRAIPYSDNGTRSVTLGVKNFTHVRFSISTPKNATFALPAIRVKPTE